MRNTIYKAIKRFGVILILFYLSGCALTNSISNGSLENGRYFSSTNEFNFPIPANAVVFDELHPLGGWVVLRNLIEPTIKQGISYNNVALPKNGLTIEQAKGIIKSGHDFWLAGGT